MPVTVGEICAILFSRWKIACDSICCTCAEKFHKGTIVLDTQKKLLALEWGSELFETYFYRRHFLTRTDHIAVQWLRNLKNAKGQLARWLEWLSD